MRTIISVTPMACWFSVIALVGCRTAKTSPAVIVPDEPPVELEPVAHMTFEPIRESSGLVRSRQWPDVFWTHNDSGDESRIFAIRRDGSVIHPEGRSLGDYKGIEIRGAVNIDWEDIAADDEGNLIIAACGNNANTRRDLALYIVPEPWPEHTTVTRVTRTIPFYFPDQPPIPGSPRNFDCEAVFWARGRIYLLTKHRSDRKTKLYRLDEARAETRVPLTLLGEFDIGGMVTAADASPDGRRLAVLTYDAVWLFELAGRGDDYFGGAIRRLPIKAKQCEALCFDGETLRIGNEQRELFVIPIDRLRVVRAAGGK